MSYPRKQFNFTWKKIDKDKVQVKLVSKINGDVYIGYGKNIAEASNQAYNSTPFKAEFEPKSVLRKTNE